MDWQVLVVKNRSEKRVVEQLKHMGIQSYAPTQKQLRQWSDRKKMVEVVLFCRYVFVEFVHGIQQKVFQLPNIQRFLTFGDQPAKLKETEILLIRQLCGLEKPITISYEQFHVGETVEILQGPLRGEKGVIIAINGISKIQLAIPGLHCFAHVEITREYICHNMA